MSIAVVLRSKHNRTSPGDIAVTLFLWSHSSWQIRIFFSLRCKLTPSTESWETEETSAWHYTIIIYGQLWPQSLLLTKSSFLSPTNDTLLKLQTHFEARISFLFTFAGSFCVQQFALFPNPPDRQTASLCLGLAYFFSFSSHISKSCMFSSIPIGI